MRRIVAHGADGVNTIRTESSDLTERTDYCSLSRMLKPVNPTLILRAREKRIGRKALAEELGVREAYILEMLNGRRSVTLPVLRKLRLKTVVVAE